MNVGEKFAVYGGIFACIAVMAYAASFDPDPTPTTLTPSQKATIEQRVRDLVLLGQLEYGIPERRTLVAAVDYEPLTEDNLAEAACSRYDNTPVSFIVSINEKMAARCFNDVMSDAIPHEVGHLIACHYTKDWAQHGAIWENATRYLGAPANVHHRCEEGP